MKVLLICGDNNERYKEFIEDRIDKSEVKIDSVDCIEDFDEYARRNEYDRVIVEFNGDDSEDYRISLQEFINKIYNDNTEVVFLLNDMDSDSVAEMYFDEAYLISSKYAIVRVGVKGTDAGIWRVLLTSDIEEIYKELRIDEDKRYLIGSLVEKVESIENKESKEPEVSDKNGLFNKLFGRNKKNNVVQPESQMADNKSADSTLAECTDDSTEDLKDIEDIMDELDNEDESNEQNTESLDESDDLKENEQNVIDAGNDSDNSDETKTDNLDKNNNDELWDDFDDVDTDAEIEVKSEVSIDDEERNEEEDADMNYNDSDFDDELLDHIDDENNTDSKSELYEKRKPTNNFSIDYSDSKVETEKESRFDVYDTDIEDLEDIKPSVQLSENLEELCKGRKVTMFIGTRNSGNTTTAFNIARVLESNRKLVAYLDFDISMHGCSYLNASNFGMIHIDSNREVSLNKMVEKPDRCYEYAVLVSNNIHYFGIGITSGPSEYLRNMSIDSWYRVITRLKNKYDAIIIDVPFAQLNKCAKGIVGIADNILLNVEWSTKSFMELVLYTGNIASDDDRDEVFDRARLIINKYRDEKVFGLDKPMLKSGKFNVGVKIDEMMTDLLNEAYQFEFSKMRTVGVVRYDKNIANSMLQKLDKKQIKNYLDIAAKI